MMLILLSKQEIIRKYLELEKDRNKLEIDIEKIKKEKEALEKELRKYKNSNTPPSANQHLKPSVLPHRSGKKRGAPRGHLPFNRPWNSNTTPQHITAEECPNCQSDDIAVLRTARQQIDEIPKEIKPESKIVERDICECNKCHFKFHASDGLTPKQGRFGINLMVLTILLRFIVRGVMRKTAIFLDASFAVKLAPASVQAIITRAAEAGNAEYDIIKMRIRAALRLHVDETSFSVLGQKWWVWIFRSDTEKLIVIRHSRGNNVLEEILGKDYAGVVHCDCWRAYDYLTNAALQRCWAHLLRKSEELKTITGKHFNDKLTALFDEIKKFNKKERTPQQRIKKYDKMTAKLQKITQYYAQYEDCKKVTKYINFHIESWFTCIKYENVEPTNNLAEQAIRETVIVRKIIGAFRSTHGVKTYETLASLIATWQSQQKDIKQELHRMLTSQLC
jgi:transposase